MKRLYSMLSFLNMWAAIIIGLLIACGSPTNKARNDDTADTLADVEKASTKLPDDNGRPDSAESPTTVFNETEEQPEIKAGEAHKTVSSDKRKVSSGKSQEVSIIQFGAKGDGNTDDSKAVTEAISFLKKNNSHILMFPKGEYPISVSVDVDGIHFKGPGKLISVNGKQDFILRVRGNDNVFDGLSFFEKNYAKNLLILDGNNNSVVNCVFDTPRKSTSQNVVYSDRLLTLVKEDGKGNVIKGCKFNNGRVGVFLSGSYKLLDSEISNCIMGVLARPSTRNSEIARNTIRDNNVTNKSGADGILAQRNVSNLHIHNNKIYKSGEHGVYFQGDNSVIENNEIYENHGSGIKLASYTTQLYNYKGKTPYIGHNNVIRNNKVYNNSTNPNDKTNAGIYLQAPLRDITVTDNICSGNYNGIRSVSVASLKESEYSTRAVLRNLKFINNKAIDNRSASLSIEGETGIVIEGNIADRIVTSAKSASHRIEKPVIKNNEIKEELLINRAAGSVIEDNRINRLNINSNSRNGKHQIGKNTVKSSNQ